MSDTTRLATAIAAVEACDRAFFAPLGADAAGLRREPVSLSAAHAG